MNGPETVSLLHVVLAFCVVFALLGAFGFGLRAVVTRGIKLPGLGAPAARRLSVVESVPVDIRHRLVLVRCDDREHLLLLGPQNNVVVASPAPPMEPGRS